jgi:hypothetical protein
MDTKAAILALMGFWGVGFASAAPSLAQEAPPLTDEAEKPANPLLNKIWVRTDVSPDLPGPMQIFLGDGTLVTDSCWETYRLSKWQRVSDMAISWEEDGVTINADIGTLTETELVLYLTLGKEVLEQRFAVAEAPYVCPDIVKD